MQVLLFVLLAISCAFAEDVVVTWTGNCNGNQGFGFNFLSQKAAGGNFGPDTKMGLTVPCDEYFEISFSFVDAITGHVISFPAANGNLYTTAQSSNVNGIVTVKMLNENPGFGNGYLATTNALDTVTNTAYAFTCTNAIASVQIKTNYFLTATNDAANPADPANYQRKFNTVTEMGNWTPSRVIPNPTDLNAFKIGQTMCNSAAGTPITGFAFPAVTGNFATAGGSPVTITPTSAQATSAQATSAQATSAQATSAQATSAQVKTSANQQATSAQVTPTGACDPNQCKTICANTPIAQCMCVGSQLIVQCGVVAGASTLSTFMAVLFSLVMAMVVV